MMHKREKASVRLERSDCSSNNFLVSAKIFQNFFDRFEEKYSRNRLLASSWIVEVTRWQRKKEEEEREKRRG